MTEIVKSWDSCIGSISDGIESWDICCSIRCSDSGRLSVDLDDLALTDTSNRLYLAANGSDRSIIPYLKLKCVAPDGTQLISDHVYITELSHPSNSQGAWVRLKGEAARLEAVTAVISTGTKATLLYHTLGMRGFDAVIKEFSDLTLRVEAPHEVDDLDRMSGGVLMEGKNVGLVNEWIIECDKKAETLLRVISFGQGRMIRWTARDLWVDDQLASTLFVGPTSGGPALEAPFSHLHMEPVIELASTRFATGLSEPRNLSVAMEWLVIPSVYAEVRFMNAAAAFENLLAGNGVDGSLLPRSVFKSMVRKPIEKLLQSDAVRETILESSLGVASDDLTSIITAMTRQLGELNRKPFQDRLNSFLARYDVPLADLPLTVKDLLRTRNKVVHGADNPNPQYSITQQATMMREVLRRTILAMLNFEGQFFSYVHGPEWLTFRAPPTTGA